MSGNPERGLDAVGAAREAADSPILEWLRRMGDCVRDRDFAAGRELFAEGVIGFGTREPHADGLVALERDQWRPIWTTTEGFRFDLDSAWIRRSGRLAFVAVRWSSFGIDGNGGARDRRGRATLVLDLAGEEPVCIHSHFSLDPTPER